MSALIKDEEVSLDIIGGGKDLEKLQALSSELGLDEHVNFLGRLENTKVLEHYANCSYVVVNSRVETFSVVAAEALMAGKPVVATRCGGLEEFIDEEQGILIDVDDQKELLQALRKMNGEYSDYDPQKLHDHAAALFSKESVGKKLNDIYRSLIK